MSFNQVLVDQPQPQIARSAVILGEVHVGAAQRRLLINTRMLRLVAVGNQPEAPRRGR